MNGATMCGSRANVGRGRFAVWFVACGLFAVAGCSKDEEVVAFIQQNDEVVAEIVRAESPDTAKSAFDKRRANLVASFGAIKGARGFQVKKETMARLTQSVAAGTTKVCSLEIKVILDKDKSAKYRELCDDYKRSFRF